MAPTKGKGLAAIRKQAAAHRRTQNTGLAGSAFNTLERKNEALKYGFERTSDFPEDDEQTTWKAPAKKKAAKPAPKRVTKPKPRAPPKPAAPIIESWRPAGGQQPKKRIRKTDLEKITDSLGLARISTWRLEAFQKAALKLIEEAGEHEEMTTSELVHGGESVTDVYVKFRSAIVAEMVKEKIDGQMVEGRKMNVVFV